jgi:Kef-type K+ transport system membrane component KefB
MHGGGLALAMLAVFGSARLLAELCERLRQPGIVGEILAGILIGPALLGWVTPDPVLDAFADLGVMFLLFRVGLEVRPSEFAGLGKTAVWVATLGVIAPLLLGWAVMRAFGQPTIESWFVAAAMVATSVGITARVLEAKRLLAEVSSRTILAAAVIDDVLGLAVLAAVSSLARGGIHWIDLATTFVLACGFTILVARWGSRALSHVMPRLEAGLRGPDARFTLAILLMFGLAVMAVYAGVAAIIGAFLAGMALSGTAEARVHTMTHGVAELFAPFFLAGIGIHLDLISLVDRSTALLAVAILAAAVVSKIVGCGLGALKLGRREALKIGIGMMPRGEVGLVVAQLGLSLAVIPQQVYGIVVFMSVATTLLAPPALDWAYRTGRSTRA